MKKFILLFVAFIHVGITAAQIPPAVADRFQTILDSIGGKYNIKGVSAAVLIPGRGVWTGTHGESHAGVPLNKDMLFCMGSNTKTYLAVLFLRMQEAGLLSLDDSVGRWIQGFPNINGNASLRQCLNHTSGITDYFQNGAMNDSILGRPGKIWTSEEIVRFAPGPYAAPGVKWTYSNTNYILLGMVAEKVLNKPWHQALQEMVLNPLDLKNTFLYGQEPSSVVSAHPWSMNITGVNLTDLTTTPYLDQLFSLAQAAGGLMVTAEDNVHFWHKLQQGLVLHDRSWQEMKTTVSAGGGVGYGLGLMRRRNSNGRMVWEHGGTFFGYLHENSVDTLSGVCISVLSNQDSMNNGGLQQLLVTRLHKEVLSTPILGTDQPEQLALGVYPNPTSGELRLQRLAPTGTLRVVMYSSVGQEVLTQVLAETEERLDIRSVPPGTYMLKAWGEGGVYHQRVVVQ